MSNAFFKTKNKALIQSIIDKADLQDFVPRLEDETHPPLSAYFKDLGQLIKSREKKHVQFFSTSLNNWSDPLDLIHRRMMESFTDLSREQQNGIIRLLAYSYWYGAQLFIKDFGLGPLNEVIANNKDYARKCIENAQERGDKKRVEAEKIIIKILNINSEIPQKNNLKELLIFLHQKSPEIKKLQRDVLSLVGQFMSAGERVFDSFLKFHTCTIVGLQTAGLVPKSRLRGFGFPRYRYLLNYSNVWDQIIPALLSDFGNDEDLEEINENLEGTLEKITQNEEYLWAFADLPFRSKFFAIYLWGFSEVFDVSDKEFLPMFADWFSALKAGYLDHRSWIFKKDTVIQVINTLKAVRRGKIPKNGIIDLEPWTINDLYQHHPQGKDVQFWRELLIQINERLIQNPENRELSRHISAVLDGAY